MIFLADDDFNNFLRANALWIALVFLAIIVVVLAVLLIINFLKPKKSGAKIRIDSEELLIAVGGKENIISSSLTGSRISLILHDYSKVDVDKLKLNGIVTVIKMTSKITLVANERSDTIFEALKKE